MGIRSSRENGKTGTGLFNGERWLMAQSESTRHHTQSRSGSHRTLTSALLAALIAGLLVVATIIATIGVMNSIAQSRTPRTQQATITLRTGTVVHTVNATLVAVPESTLTVKGEGTVTRAGVSKGGDIKEGSVISTIQERPIIALQGPVPMYRALGRGDTGRNVAQLQDSLRRLGYRISDAPGSYGPTTAVAVSYLYDSAGFSFPDRAGAALPKNQRMQAGLPRQEAVFISSLPAVAQTACGSVGTAVSEALCSVSTKRSTFYTRVLAVLLDGVEAESFKGLSATVSNGKNFKGTIGEEASAEIIENAPGSGSGAGASGPQGVRSDSTTGDVGSSTANGDPAASQYRYFAFSPADGVKLEGSVNAASVTINIAKSKKPGLILASVALRQAAGNTGKYWIETSGHKHVNVDVGLCYGGECEVRGNGLKDGLGVLVPANASASAFSGTSEGTE